MKILVNREAGLVWRRIKARKKFLLEPLHCLRFLCASVTFTFSTLQPHTLCNVRIIGHAFFGISRPPVSLLSGDNFFFYKSLTPTLPLKRDVLFECCPVSLSLSPFFLMLKKLSTIALRLIGSSVMKSTRSRLIVENKIMSLNSNVYVGFSNEFPSSLIKSPPKILTNFTIDAWKFHCEPHQKSIDVLARQVWMVYTLWTRVVIQDCLATVSLQF